MNTALKALYGRCPQFPPVLRTRIAYLSDHCPPETLKVPEDLDRLFSFTGEHLESIAYAVETFFLLCGHGQYQRQVLGVLTRVNNYLQAAHPAGEPYPTALLQAQDTLNSLRTPFTDEVCSKALSVAPLFSASHCLSTDLGALLDKVNLLMLAVVTPVMDSSKTSVVWVDQHFDQLEGWVDNAQLAFALRREGLPLYYRVLELIHQTHPSPYAPFINTPEHVLAWTLAKGTFDTIPELAKTLPLSVRARVNECAAQLGSVATLRDQGPRETVRLHGLLEKTLLAAGVLHAQSYAMVKLSHTLLQVLHATLVVQWEYFFYHLENASDIPDEFLTSVNTMLTTVLEG